MRAELKRVLKPFVSPARYKGLYGGRGSGKSHFFAQLLIARHIHEPGLRSVCIREVQKSLKESAKRLIEDKLEALGLGLSDGFRAAQEIIHCPGGGQIIFQGMQDHTAESIKSLEGYGVAWVEEAQTLSSNSLTLLRPTIREDGSELWFSWNPRRKNDPVDKMFRGDSRPTDAISLMLNWAHNNHFPDVLEQERQDCLRNAPEEYDHIWEGGYATVASGAYFAKGLAQAKAEHRIGNLAADPLLSKRAYWDIGGTGAKADAVAIWITQFVGKEIRVLDYYEVSGQPLAAHTTWLRDNGYDKITCVLPHDGETNDKVYDVSYASALTAAGFPVVVIPNQGKGAAMARIEAVRRILPQCWFDEKKTEAGRMALGWYHEKKDEARNIGLGPEHDWASHGADAFGLMAVAYEKHSAPAGDADRFKIPQMAGGWMK